MKGLKFVLSLINVFILISISSTNCYTSDVIKYQNITITGIIKNYKSISEFLDKDSFFQLVKVPSSFEILGKTNVKGFEGRIMYVSDGPKVSVKEDGSFKINNIEIDSGLYIILVQLSSKELIGILGNFRTNFGFINNDISAKEMKQPYTPRVLLKIINNDTVRAALINIDDKVSDGSKINLGDLYVLFYE
jgi:hypothetical protein